MEQGHWGYRYPERGQRRWQKISLLSSKAAGQGSNLTIAIAFWLSLFHFLSTSFIFCLINIAIHLGIILSTLTNSNSVVTELWLRNGITEAQESKGTHQWKNSHYLVLALEWLPFLLSVCSSQRLCYWNIFYIIKQ